MSREGREKGLFARSFGNFVPVFGKMIKEEQNSVAKRPFRWYTKGKKKNPERERKNDQKRTSFYGGSHPFSA